MAYQTHNPYTGETTATFDTLTDEELEQKLQKSEAAFQEWRKTSFEERAKILNRAADLAEERTDEISRINTIETGKLLGVSLWETGVVVGILRYYAERAKELLKPTYIDNPDKTYGDAVGIYQPLGIIYMIEPWNVPFFQMARPAAAQLMAGNVVVLKHASICPQCALTMEKLFADAGLPEGCFTNLFINYEQSDKVIADPRVCGVTLTGSSEVGRHIAEQAGKNLKKCVMELGGSDAMVVMPDADLETAVAGAINGRMTLSGQICASSKRMFVHESLYDAFMKRVKEEIDGLKLGDPLSLETTLAPLSSEGAAEKVNAQIAKAVAHGAIATEAGPKVPKGGAYVQPTFLTNVTEDNPIAGEEIFGPVLMVFSWSDEDEVVRLANSTAYGLCGSVYSESLENAARMADKLETGTVSVNFHTLVTAAIPFGGIKESGFGRELGPDGIREFTNKKFIVSPSMDMKKMMGIFE